MTPQLIAKHAVPVPRYTSYPSAPHFQAGVGPADYRDWLEHVAASDALSLYTHIPYCDELCWYCGCNTKATKRYEPVSSYLEPLLAEIAMVGRHVASRRVVHMHWGGGSPNVLSPDDILRLSDALLTRFVLEPGAEFAVEVDPRRLSAEQVRAFRQGGVNRVSIGVQDFEKRVQEAINRRQPFEVTRRTVDLFRDAGVRSVNLDLVYGLPYQTVDSARRTLELALTLSPDRIALFGYAHLPARLKHQRLIPDDALPAPMERYRQSTMMAEHLLAAGYVRIGLDHFALPTDELATRPLHRNFQGYTCDAADTLLGFGASSIGRIGDLGYVQNQVATAAYDAAIRKDGLATCRGLRLSPDDRIRAHVIERLMCDLAFPADLVQRFGQSLAQPMLGQAREIIADDVDGLVEARGDGFRVTERGRPFIRSICACFDTYLETTTVRHSAGV